MTPSKQEIDLAVIGAGAAGLMAAIQAGRVGRGRSIIAFDGAKHLGAKILVAGGGRCNVTHHAVDETTYAGSSPNAVRKVLRGFGVEQTVQFFADLGVELKREGTGKLFPTTDKARTVLDALLGAAREAGVELCHPCRVESLEQRGEAFVIGGAWGEVIARRVILATGGKALPKSGSDGLGYRLVEGLGHQLTARVTPALVPLLLAETSPLLALSGIATEAALEVRAATGKRLSRIEGSTLCTHFGISGPAPMNISRHYTDAILDDPAAQLVISWFPEETRESLEQKLLELGSRTLLRFLSAQMPERLAVALCEEAGIDPKTFGRSIRKEQRKALLTTLLEMPLPVTGDRGYPFAEVTAGGVPLREVTLHSMESRLCPGLHLCGEILDVDGRIGGYNFQWAWATGAAAGRGAVL